MITLQEMTGGNGHKVLHNKPNKVLLNLRDFGTENNKIVITS